MFHENHHVGSEYALRNKLIVELRRRGFTFGQLGLRFGITPARAQKIYTVWTSRVPMALPQEPE